MAAVRINSFPLRHLNSLARGRRSRLTTSTLGALERLILQLPPRLDALKTQFQESVSEKGAAGMFVPDAQVALWRVAFVPSGVKSCQSYINSVAFIKIAPNRHFDQ